MKIKELREKNPAELKKLLAGTRELMRELRFSAASKQLKDVRDLREAKKMIARILTLETEIKNKK
jgi:ribosomal protein L29